MRVFIIVIAALWFLVSCGNSSTEVVTNPLDSADSVQNPVDLLNAEIRSNPNSANGYYKRSAYYEEQGELEKAKQDLNLCINMSPELGIYYLAKSRICYKQGLIEQAELYAKAAKQRDSQLKEAYLMLGKIYLGIPNFDGAIAELDSALMIDKFYADSYFYKGMTFARAGDTLRAVSSFQTAVQQDPDMYKAYLELAMLYEKNESEDRKLALEYYDNALAIAPESIEALLAKGKFCQDNGMIPEAFISYSKIIDIDNTFEVAFHNRGYLNILLYEDGGSADYNDSIMLAGVNDFSNAIKLNSNYVQAYHNRGLCFETLGDVVAAKLDYATALKIDQTFVPSQQGLDRLQ